MIVHILPPSATFKAVNYNTDKIERDKGELMKIANFGSLQGLSMLRPEDYRLYMQSLSALNKRVHFPQFHAVISTKGKNQDKTSLTEIATQWMAAMGYGEQPYLIVYHKDTANNHVHIVSTRIDRDGKKISSGFENVRAVNNLNKVLGTDEKYSAKEHIKNAFTYAISTKAQFMMILENQGYTLRENGRELEVIKFGVKQDVIALSAIDDQIKMSLAKQERITQLKAIFHKYSGLYDTSLKPANTSSPGGFEQKTAGYTSAFAAFLKEKFGIMLVFHAKGEQPPYGYSVIDHSGKGVYKGGEIMPLKELLAVENDLNYLTEPVTENLVKDANDDLKAYYGGLLKAAMYNYPDLIQGLQHQNLAIIQQGENFILADQSTKVFLDCEDLLNEKNYSILVRELEYHTNLQESPIYSGRVPAVHIAPDVDDEAINGRNRKRKKKARTNTR